jgi:Ca2+-binding EF-hand superfamily protein
MLRLKSIFILCFALVLFASAEVSMRNLVEFWKETYDRNNDGHATLEEFVEFFQHMEPEHHIIVEDIIPIFKFFDANLDLKVTLKEVIELSRVKVTS